MNKQDLQNIISSSHEEGKKVAVSFCSHVPQEVLAAAGLTSLRVPYIRDVKDSASKILIRNLCPVVKNCCDICEDEALKDAISILSGSGRCPNNCGYPCRETGKEDCLACWTKYFDEIYLIGEEE